MAGDTAFLWSPVAERGMFSEAALLVVVSGEAVTVFNSPFDNDFFLTASMIHSFGNSCALCLSSENYRSATK